MIRRPIFSATLLQSVDIFRLSTLSLQLRCICSPATLTLRTITRRLIQSSIGLLAGGLVAAVFSTATLAQSSTPNEKLFRSEQLQKLTAPIALFPDPLLALILMASTYPVEVLEANRWRIHNKNMNQDELKIQSAKKGWDQSVVALLAIPEVLTMMSINLSWTLNLGDAILAQSVDVLIAIQRLRARAADRKMLVSNQYQTVSAKEWRNAIAIEPIAPDTINLPIYDPLLVFAPWPHPQYPPSFLPWPGDLGSLSIVSGMAFSSDYAVARWRPDNDYWGGGVNWDTPDINVNRPIDIGRSEIRIFKHNPEHRRGVQYRSEAVGRRYRGLRTNLPQIFTRLRQLSHRSNPSTASKYVTVAPG